VGGFVQLSMLMSLLLVRSPSQQSSIFSSSDPAELAKGRQSIGSKQEFDVTADIKFTYLKFVKLVSKHDMCLQKNKLEEN
jgi:hypothetical protein